jgi:hypothetical protein
VIAAVHALLFAILFSLLQWLIFTFSLQKGVNKPSWIEGLDNANKLCDLPKTSDEYRNMLKYVSPNLDFQAMKGYLGKVPPIQDIVLNIPEFKKIDENTGLSNQEKIAQSVKLINDKLNERDAICPKK